ncbi:hypothetical protein SAY86_017643 [Trapa natans]|uniref:RRM domain-containing protein n=1 Tax=Trapa natans TaxID=22666 RepID=A0AAN7R2W9_TRANT|nr:hypothetical protein SAY86_017643 [Trapa natans]
MGKSSKKSAPKVDAAPAVVPELKSVKKGKRELEDVPEKKLAVKKQKKVVDVEQTVEKQKVEVKTHIKLNKKKQNSSSDDSSEEETKKPVTKTSDDMTKPAAKIVKKSLSNGSSDDESDSSSDDEAPSPMKAVMKRSNESLQNNSEETDSEDGSDDSDSEPQNKKAKLVVNGQTSKKESSDEDSEESSDDEPKQAALKDLKKSDESEEESSSEDESEEKETIKTPIKDSDVEMLDSSLASNGKTPKTPITPLLGDSKTVFMGNLPFSVEKADIEGFFGEIGEVVDVRIAVDHDGRSKGFGHVDFSTAEAAKKAVELNGDYLNNRPVKIDLARERSFSAPSGKESNFSQREVKGQTKTLFIRGLDISLGEDHIRSVLNEHFGSCGEISRISIPKDYDSGEPKGFAYLDFSDENAFNKGLQLNGTEIDDNILTVEEARPRGDQFSGGGRGDRSGGRGGGRGRGGRFSGGRDGGRGGRDGGRFSGGRGRGGGRHFGSGGRGRGSNKSNFSGTGKKTSFGDHE